MRYLGHAAGAGRPRTSTVSRGGTCPVQLKV